MKYSDKDVKELDLLFSRRNRSICYFTGFLEHGDKFCLYEALKLAFDAEQNPEQLKKIKDFLEI